MPFEVAIVVYRPQLDELTGSLEAIAQFGSSLDTKIRVCLWHNDEGPRATPGLEVNLAGFSGRLQVQHKGGGQNLGYGRAINAHLPDVAAPHLLVLNQDAIPEPGALMQMWRTAQGDHAHVAAWELRQIPYEHPKDYDPVTGETGWFSGAAVLLRTAALRQVGGFEPRFFMYCEDVDLAWRLRCAGWRLRYLPRSAVVHRTYRYPGEAKPLAVLGGAYANLCIRTRFAGRRHVVDGLRDLWRRWRRQASFAGERSGLAHAALKFALNYRYFRRTRQSAPGFVPCLNGNDYEIRRDGSFHPFLATAERMGPLPPITVLVNATGGPADLDEWLTCLENQTHRPVEILVCGGNTTERRPVCDAWRGRLAIRALPSTGSPLETVASVHAQADWWLLFQSEQVLPYADHAEVLLHAAQQAQATGAAALHWSIHADSARRCEAHREHAQRTTIGGPPSQRPSRLVHRCASQIDGDVHYIPVEKLTTLRYEMPPA